MLAQASIHAHRQRSRTRSTAFLLALTVFAATKLIANGAVNVSHRASEVEGMQMLDVECGSDQTVHC